MIPTMVTELDERTGLIYTEDDLQMRLGKSLVRVNGQPFFVSGIDGRFVMGLFTETGKDFSFHLPTKALDVRPVPLGYVNTLKMAVYCTRQPARRYKQGLCVESLRAIGGYAPRDLLTSKCLAECILNVYPSFREVCSVVRENKLVTSRAFSRRFCVEKDDSGVLFLKYRGENVGWINKGLPELGESHKYLTEELVIAVGEIV